MLELLITFHLRAHRLAARAAHLLVRAAADRARNERGQATAEYALVLLGAATVALLLVAWAAKSGKIATLLDAVIDKVIDQV